MTTPARPTLNTEVIPPRPEPQTKTRPELPLAKELPPWDLIPSDLLLVRRRPVKK